MEEVIKERITHYTTVEGGNWLSCKPWTVPGKTKLAMAQRCAVMGSRYAKHTLLLKYEPLHSFKTSEGREWDVINGWRDLVALRKIKGQM